MVLKSAEMRAVLRSAAGVPAHGDAEGRLPRGRHHPDLLYTLSLVYDTSFLLIPHQSFVPILPFHSFTLPQPVLCLGYTTRARFRRHHVTPVGLARSLLLFDHSPSVTFSLSFWTRPAADLPLVSYDLPVYA